MRIRDRLLSIMLPDGTPTYKRWISLHEIRDCRSTGDPRDETELPLAA